MGENDVKGKIVIDQLKRYTRKLADATGGAGNVQINVWYYPDSYQYNIRFSVWDSVNNQIHKPLGEPEDIRAIGEIINQIEKARRIK